MLYIYENEKEVTDAFQNLICKSLIINHTFVLLFFIIIDKTSIHEKPSRFNNFSVRNFCM